MSTEEILESLQLWEGRFNSESETRLLMDNACRKILELQAIIHQQHEILKKVPRWISVKDKPPEDDEDVLVTDGENCAVGFYRPDAKAWDSCLFGWLENRSEPPIGINTVTHWAKLPALPKEE